MSSNSHYSKIAQFLHWLIAGLIIGQYLLAELAESAEHSGKIVQQLALLANHKSIGMTVLFLAVVRLVWRLTHQPPALPQTMPKWQHTASHLAHWSIYALIFLLPISGWLMSSASAYSVSWFNLFVFPDLLASDKSNADFLEDIHELLGDALLVLVLLHVAAALKHHFIDKDGVLERMASKYGWGIFVVSIAVILVAWGRLFPTDKPVNSQQNIAYLPAQDAPSEIIDKSDLPVWAVDYQQSFIRFTGDQAGAPFTGEWTQWSASMQFDEQRLAEGLFDVEIQTLQINSGDEERDGYIIGNEFFDAEKFQIARFQANNFTQTEEGKYQSNGQLSIKGLSKAVLFTFSIKREQGKLILEGTSTIDRMSWNIGTGDWTDPTWVGHDVIVEVKVVANE